eukprot:54668-Pyramimonas_sp.AAC.1
MLGKVGGLSTNPQEGVDNFTTMLRIASRNNNVQDPIHNLTRSAFGREKQAPHMRTETSETRHLRSAFYFILTVRVPPEATYEALCRQCVKALRDFYVELQQRG